MSGTALHQRLADADVDVSWSLRVAGGGATPFRTWLALQTLVLDPGQACPLAQQIVAGPSTLGADGSDPDASLDAAIRAWEGANAVAAYCTGEGGLNASQAGAVLAAAAPSAAQGIALIQVGSMQMLAICRSVLDDICFLQ